MAESWRGFLKGFVGRLVVSLLVLAAIAVGLVVVASYSFTSGICGNRIAREVSSPDGKWKAVLYERDCGATTDFSTQVSILRQRQDVGNDNGNVFIADSFHAMSAITVHQ